MVRSWVLGPFVGFGGSRRIRKVDLCLEINFAGFESFPEAVPLH